MHHRVVFRTLPNIENRIFCKNTYALSASYFLNKKYTILKNAWQGSAYTSAFHMSKQTSYIKYT